jgi:hypothetical protein
MFAYRRVIADLNVALLHLSCRFFFPLASKLSWQVCVGVRFFLFDIAFGVFTLSIQLGIAESADSRTALVTEVLVLLAKKDPD